MEARSQAQGQLKIKQVESRSVTWMDVENPAVADMEHLRRKYGFHPLAVEDVLARVQMPKVDDYGNYLFIVLHFPIMDKEARLTVASEVDFFVGSDYVITLHSGDLRPLTKLFSDCAQSEAVQEELLSQSSGFLLYRIVSALVDYCFPILSQVIDSVDAAEKTLLSARGSEPSRVLAELRREILAYRRIIRPQIDVLELMENTEYPFLKVDPDVYFGDLADQIRRIWVELEDLKETVEGLHDTNVTLTTIRTTEVTRVLTILFTLTLPATLVGTLYGMNVRLPFEEGPYSFVILASIIGTGTLGLVALLRVRRWL